MAETIKIGGELESMATGNVVAAASAIKDKVKNKYQGEINAEVDIHLESLDNKTDSTDADVESLENRIHSVEELAEISVGGGNIQIVNTGEDIQPGSGKVATANALADSYGSYIENPEFFTAWVDSNNHLLFWLRAEDGGVDWAIGVPKPVKDYVNSKVAEIWEGNEGTQIDGLNKIIAFLNDFSISDTLTSVLNTKVTKVVGKSLIDEDVAENVNYTDCPEFIDAELDGENKILEGHEKDGTKFFETDVKLKGNKVDTSTVSVMSVENPEFMSVELDNDGKILEDRRNDGTKEIHTDVEVKGKSTMGDMELSGAVGIKTDENPEFMEVEIDDNGKIVGGRKSDGKKFDAVGFETPNISVDGSRVETAYDPENRMDIGLDNKDRIIHYRDNEGIQHENVGLETNKLILTEEGMSDFKQALKDAGVKNGSGDWSDYISNNGKTPLHLPVPRIAYINLTNATNDLTWPQTKTADKDGIIEFADMEGNYFKKNIIFNAQGNSSMNFIKKNGSIKMFDGSIYNSKGKKGKGDKFGVKFGDWVPQTTYHIKSFYTDYFKGVSWISYQIALAVANTHNVFENRTWKKGIFNNMEFSDNQFENPQIDDSNLQIDNGALCQPDGFPCIIFLNGEFYGIYVWFIKKDAANFNMDADNPNHIHLDGRIANSSLFNAGGVASNILWNPGDDTGIEVRNPEDLVIMTPYQKKGKDCWEYDGDVNAVQELAGVNTIDDIVSSYSASDTYVKSDIVMKNGRMYLSLSDDNTGHDPEEAKCTKHGDEFDKATKYWIDITFTNEVKKGILKLSASKANVESAATTQDKKALFENYFDLDNQVDYMLVQEATKDTDGLNKNWQWTTWDGNKWFINNYDKDCSFGNAFNGMLTRTAPETKEAWADYLVARPFNIAFLIDNYDHELKERWKELVNKGIFTKEYIISLFLNWTQRIGADNYKREYDKWSESPCNRDSGINSEYWKVKSWTYSVISHDNYNSETQYTVGDTCIIHKHACDIEFECVSDCVNEYPISIIYTNYPTVLGYRDNLWRVSVFIEKNLDVINDFVNNI